MNAAAKTPKSKTQIPNKPQNPNPKQTVAAPLEPGAWSLEFLWDLGFGVWSLSFPSLSFQLLGKQLLRARRDDFGAGLQPFHEPPLGQRMFQLDFLALKLFVAGRDINER